MSVYVNTVDVYMDFELYTRVRQEWIEGYRGALLVIVELYSDLESREEVKKQKLA